VTTADRPEQVAPAVRADGAAEDRYDAGDIRDWQRQVVWWDRTFVAIVALTAVALPLSGVAGRQLWVGWAAMAAILAAYAAWGGPAARSRDQRRATAYVVVLVAGTAVTVAQDGVATLLLFAAFSQVWMLLEPARRCVGGGGGGGAAARAPAPPITTAAAAQGDVPAPGPASKICTRVPVLTSKVLSLTFNGEGKSAL
jgi:hypothetical protein